METEKTFLVDLIFMQAYEHPKFAKLRIPGTMYCPNCTCEVAHVINDDGARRVLWCSNCGATYKEKDMVA